MDPMRMMGGRKPLKRKNSLEPKDIPFVSICCLEKDFSKYLDLKGVHHLRDATRNRWKSWDQITYERTWLRCWNHQQLVNSDDFQHQTWSPCDMPRVLETWRLNDPKSRYSRLTYISRVLFKYPKYRKWEVPNLGEASFLDDFLFPSTQGYSLYQYWELQGSDVTNVLQQNLPIACCRPSRFRQEHPDVVVKDLIYACQKDGKLNEYIGSMGMVYLPTFGVFFCMVNVGKYTIYEAYGMICGGYGMPDFVDWVDKNW